MCMRKLRVITDKALVLIEKGRFLAEAPHLFAHNQMLTNQLGVQDNLNASKGTRNRAAFF